MDLNLVTIAAFPQSHDCDCRPLQSQSMIVDYYNILYMRLPLKSIWKLQLVQNAKGWGIMCAPLIRAYYFFGLLAALVINVLPDLIQGVIKPFMAWGWIL